MPCLQGPSQHVYLIAFSCCSGIAASREVSRGPYCSPRIRMDVTAGKGMRARVLPQPVRNLQMVACPAPVLRGRVNDPRPSTHRRTALVCEVLSSPKSSQQTLGTCTMVPPSQHAPPLPFQSFPQAKSDRSLMNEPGWRCLPAGGCWTRDPASLYPPSAGPLINPCLQHFLSSSPLPQWRPPPPVE